MAPEGVSGLLYGIGGATQQPCSRPGPTYFLASCFSSLQITDHGSTPTRDHTGGPPFCLAHRRSQRREVGFVRCEVSKRVTDGGKLCHLSLFQRHAGFLTRMAARQTTPEFGRLKKPGFVGFGRDSYALSPYLAWVSEVFVHLLGYSYKFMVSRTSALWCTNPFLRLTVSVY
jgi:hypothetical protein